MKSMIIVNFGGPRDLNEVESFLIALLTDPDVIRTDLPSFFQRWFFTRIAKKRTHKVSEDYKLIGGRSPIFEDTAAVAADVAKLLNVEVLTFHRYLLATHQNFFQKIIKLNAAEIPIFPMFPQFSFATTGSIARFFTQNLPRKITAKMRWIKSYPDHPAFVTVIQRNIRNFLVEKGLEEKDVLLLFSAHGLPRSFIDSGDIYEQECQHSFHAIRQAFPQAFALLAYQSKFGRGEWLKPYTEEVCRSILSYTQGRPHVVFIPLSFTSDHIETLFEIEYQYLPLVKRQGLNAWRCPAPNRNRDWIEAIASILHSSEFTPTGALIFHKKKIRVFRPEFIRRWREGCRRR